ncbi:hypothetical protein [Aliikangiella sp. G2MR2-5]|uniref:hypothetical protein n=1 Tax=Aliikangiella sp. G2MR2-5 TaxID=2788943 RepID=UPI0018A89419|nr:hypothetical protein [Aliikangiella sp. G2MR2-5]
MTSSLGDNFFAYRSKHFYLISQQDERYVSNFLRSLENIYFRVAKVLGDLHLEDNRRIPIIIFPDVECYYEYIAYYYPEEGEFAESGGIFVNDLIPHFAFPLIEQSAATAVAAHELTHALVSHLPIPTWLNEGLAVNIESTITGINPFHLSREKHNKHLSFWGEDEIQEFWSGESFFRVDEANLLSYQLAQLITRTLAGNQHSFHAFVADAHYDDAGEAALNKHYGLSLADVIENVFGEGDWVPQPQKWIDSTR